MSSSSVITPEDVLVSLMNDGTIDALRLKIINQLKANSKVLYTPGAEKQTKRELFDALRQELEGPVLEKASKSVWELILDNNGLGKEISETVERVFCRLSGQESPLFSSPNPENPAEKEREKDKEMDMKESSKDNSSKSKSKKRSISEVTALENTDEAAITKKQQIDSSSTVEESRKSPQSGIA